MPTLAGNPGGSVNSCLYLGELRHRRFQPRYHGFCYTLFMVYLDLTELDTVFKGLWLWSARHWAILHFNRKDHFGDPTHSLDSCVRRLVEQKTGCVPEGPIRLLTQLRFLGYCFNPISIYYCFDKTGEQVTALVAEVTNTPWGERHCYVLDMRESDSPRQALLRFDKSFHVSPFMPINLCYGWRSSLPGKRLAVHMDVLQNDGAKVFDATLVMRRKAINRRSLALVLLRFPFMTFKTIVVIYWEALRLWFKRTPAYAHTVKSDNL